jgi:hypothetical protein
MAMTAQRAHELVAEIASSDRAVQGRAYETLLTATASMVPWGYDVWPAILEGLGAQDNRLRSICAQILANLAAYSDPEDRILGDLDQLAGVMSDDRFVTARHATQVFWKVGLGGEGPCAATAAALSRRFRACAHEKNAALVRTDIIAALARLDHARPDAGIEQIARDLIDEEPGTASRRKQNAAWRSAHARPT